MVELVVPSKGEVPFIFDKLLSNVSTNEGGSHGCCYANVLWAADRLEVEGREKIGRLNGQPDTESNTDADHHDLKDLIAHRG